MLEEMRHENPRREIIPNYSEVPAINRVYNSREAIVSGSGLTDADVRRVESLVERGVSSEYICAEFDSCQACEPKKDSVSQSRAMKEALDNIEHNIRASAEAQKKPRPEMKK
jgi:hypothetical protein